jgi:hypothetical protein
LQELVLMREMHLHRSPRWLNTRLRVARLTIPQWLAVSLAVAIGGLLYWSLGLVLVPHGLVLALLAARVLVAGAAAGTLAVLFYALADDRREPFVRQAVLYPFRRHTYRSVSKECRHAQPAPRGAGLRPRWARRAAARRRSR